MTLLLAQQVNEANLAVWQALAESDATLCASCRGVVSLDEVVWDARREPICPACVAVNTSRGEVVWDEDWGIIEA